MTFLKVFGLALSISALAASAGHAEDIGCVSTTFRFIGKNDRVCVTAFDDPKVPA